MTRGKGVAALLACALLTASIVAERAMAQPVPQILLETRFSDVSLVGGALWSRGAEQQFLGTRTGNVDAFGFRRFGVTQSGETGAGTIGFQLPNRDRLTFSVSFFNTSGSAFSEGTPVDGANLLIPAIVTQGFSLSNVGGVAALGEQRFHIEQQGWASFTHYEFAPITSNGVAFHPLIYSGFRFNDTQSRYDFAIPGYDGYGYYGSIVDDTIVRGGVGARVIARPGNLPFAFVFLGTVGAAYQRTESDESFRLSLLGGTVTASEHTKISGSATGFEYLIAGGIHSGTPDGRTLFGVSTFYGGSTIGSTTRDYRGGTPILRIEDTEVWGVIGRAQLNFNP